MTDDKNQPTSMADEVTKRVTEALKPTFARLDERMDQITGEIRAAKKDIGQDIDAVNATLTAIKATVDGHTSRFRDVSSRFDDVKDHLRRIEERLDRAHLPAE